METERDFDSHIEAEDGRIAVAEGAPEASIVSDAEAPEGVIERGPLTLHECMDFEIQTMLLDLSPSDRELIEEWQEVGIWSTEKNKRKDLIIKTWWEKKYGFPFNHKERRLVLLSDKYGLLYNPNQKVKKNTRLRSKQDASVPTEKFSQVGEQSQKKKEKSSVRLRRELMAEIAVLPDDIEKILIDWTKRGKIAPDDYRVLVRYMSLRERARSNLVTKRQEIDRLQNRLKDIGGHESYSAEELQNRRMLRFDKLLGKFSVENEGGGERSVTYDDIVADAEWGIWYYPDSEMPDHQWRMVRKTSDITEARRNVEFLLNEEIRRTFQISGGTALLPEDRFFQKERSILLNDGDVAERMIKTFLIRLQRIFKSTTFRVENSNALEDEELKYDFKVSIPEKRYGVAVEGDNLSRDEYVNRKRSYGVQFTISGGPNTYKKGQINEARKHLQEKRLLRFLKRPVDDIVLLSIPLGTYRACLDKWFDAGKPSGGPEQFLSREEKIKILKAVSENFLHVSDEDIERAVDGGALVASG